MFKFQKSFYSERFAKFFSRKSCMSRHETTFEKKPECFQAVLECASFLLRFVSLWIFSDHLLTGNFPLTFKSYMQNIETVNPHAIMKHVYVTQ